MVKYVLSFTISVLAIRNILVFFGDIEILALNPPINLINCPNSGYLLVLV
jgi:hypothetical protein